MLKDLRFAFRMVFRHPWFSLAVVLVMALGIGINTTVFTLVNAALFKPFPFKGGERLVVVSQVDPKNPDRFSPLSLPDYRDLRERNRSLETLEAAKIAAEVVSEAGNPPQRYRVARLTPGMFPMLRLQPILGRSFEAADSVRGAPTVLLLGYALWKDRYAAAKDIVGRVVRFDGQPATIIGVMPEGIKFPMTEELWAPLALSAEKESRKQQSLMVFGLLKPGRSRTEAQGDLTVIASNLAKEYSETNENMAVRVQTVNEAFNGGPIRLIFLLMLGAVGFVLLIACANVANMMFSRALARHREFAVRASVGASRWQLMRLMLVESVLLSSLGGLLGLGLSLIGVRAFDLATQDVGKPYWIEFTMDWRAFLYFAALSLLSGVIFGLMPALRASRLDLNQALKDGGGAGSHRSGRLAAVLVCLQFALTVILLSGAGIMVRSFLAVQNLNPSVPADQILTARIQLPDTPGKPYETEEARRQMHARLVERLSAIPGVTEVALASEFPGLGSQERGLELEGQPVPDPKTPPHQAATIFGSPNYLQAIRVPLLLGRGLNSSDGDPGREAAVVSRDFVQRHFPQGEAVGRRFRLKDGDRDFGPWITIVGVCGDVNQDPMNHHAPPVVYLSDRQEPWAWLGLLVHGSRAPSLYAEELRLAVQGIDQDLPLFEVRSLTDSIQRQFWFLKVFGSLFFSFALIALLMASVGLYAVISQATERRTREIGVRMALGATAGSVQRLILVRGLRQLGIGLLLGLGGAFGVTRLLDSMIVTSGTDPLVYALVIVLLGSIGLVACWLPARRASRIHPNQALRVE
jgi:predicted permease